MIRDFRQGLIIENYTYPTQNARPPEAATDIGLLPVLIGYGYYALYGMPQSVREFQVDLVSGDFSSPEYSGISYPPDGDTPALWHTLSTPLTITTEYKWRFRDLTLAGDYTPWSIPTTFTTATVYIGTPTNTTPTDTATDVGESGDITLIASAFACVGGADTHASTDWEISTDESFTNVVWRSLTDSVNLETVTLSYSELAPGTIHYWRCKYYGNTYANGSFSLPFSFTTYGVYGSSTVSDLTIKKYALVLN